MGTITVASLLGRAAKLTNDTGNVRWPLLEGLDWLNDGQRALIILRPKASVKNTSVALTAGSTKQTLPADGYLFIDMPRNMGADGSTPGTVIQEIPTDTIDNQIPTWHVDANALGYIKHFVFDPRNPKNYYVYPKAPATSWYVELIYSVAPADCTQGGTITLDDIYANMLLDYVLYRAYSKDSEYAGSPELAAAYYTAFDKAAHS
jgi:hypothetical protein